MELDVEAGGEAGLIDDSAGEALGEKVGEKWRLTALPVMLPAASLKAPRLGPAPGTEGPSMVGDSWSAEGLIFGPPLSATRA